MNVIHELGRDRLSQIFIDEAYGLDLAYRLRDYGYAPNLIAFGGKPVNSAYINRRAEIYFNLKKSIETRTLWIDRRHQERACYDTLHPDSYRQTANHIER
nr:MAG TPA: hypothetical protein [Caudoviricetes sp.]